MIELAINCSKQSSIAHHTPVELARHVTPPPGV